MIQIHIKIFWPIKIKTKILVVSYHNHIFFHYHNDLIKLLQTFISDFIIVMQRYSFCMISFFNLYELFLAFVYANNMGSLVYN